MSVPHAMRLWEARRSIVGLLLSLVALSGVRAQEHSELALPPNGDNQKAEVSQWIGLVKVTIGYHSPRVHLQGADRTGKIWGGVVKYGFFDDGFGPSTATPWRAGANESTTITFSHDVKLEGKDVKAGTYALFVAIDSASPWTLILSKHIGWGGYQYDSTNDALRVSVTPQDVPFTEFLTYEFIDRLPDAATAQLRWENRRVPFRIEVPNVNELYVAQMRQDLEQWPGFNYQNWAAAAHFAADHKVNLAEALVWANRAIYEPFRNAAQGRQTYSTLETKAAVLAAMGRTLDADTTMDRAIRSEGATPQLIHRYGMSELAAGKKDRALSVFKWNADRFPNDHFLPHVGLARAYTALGDKQKAIEHWEIALKNVPSALERQRPQFEQALRALRGS